MAQDVAPKEQRIRDPVHGLIVFSATDPFEQLIWRLLNSRECQRLRRIRQLGFSELVYPGATHSRFAHSVGVFHTARILVQLLKKKLSGDFLEERAQVAACAALLHDVGHGPFSHTFEGVLKQYGRPKKHEKWTVEIIRGQTEIAEILQIYDERNGTSLVKDVANLLEQEYPSDIYSSVVSSQFDADRLDYLRRDKLMSGTEHGGFDWDWLLNNLEIEDLTIGSDGSEDHIEVPGFVVGHKGLKAAEAYLIGRFHLYTQVYMHKTTRGAEKMLAALLGRVAELASGELSEDTGLPDGHPLQMYFKSDAPELDQYLFLDDTLIYGALPFLTSATDSVVRELAQRLQSRQLYKCLDVGARAFGRRGDAMARFHRLLSKATGNGGLSKVDVLIDREKVSAYKFHEYESKDALEKIIIRRPDDERTFDDIAQVSDVVKAIGVEEIFRVYGRTPEVMARLEALWEEACK